jgi:hypothetical protein
MWMKKREIKVTKAIDYEPYSEFTWRMARSVGNHDFQLKINLFDAMGSLPSWCRHPLKSRENSQFILPK